MLGAILRPGTYFSRPHERIHFPWFAWKRLTVGCPLSVLIKLEGCRTLFKTMPATLFLSKTQTRWQKSLCFYTLIAKKEAEGEPLLARESGLSMIYRSPGKRSFMSSTNLRISKASKFRAPDKPFHDSAIHPRLKSQL